MAVDNSGDSWKLVLAAIPSVLTAIGAAIWKWTDRDKNKSQITITHERDEEDAFNRARAALDDATKEWFDNFRTHAKDLQERVREVEADAELWEGRARRADRLCLDLVLQIREERITGVRKDIPIIPRLEDPLT